MLLWLVKLYDMSDIDWNNEHNKKVLLEELRQKELKMLKSISKLYDIPHPKRTKRWWEFWK